MVDRWTDADFDRLSWHDDAVHGFRLVETGHGSADLHLDIDHIVEWLPPVEGTCRFRIAPALLTFHGVCRLRVEIDYASVSAGMTPFSLDSIVREPSSTPTLHSWRLIINWPRGELSFLAAGFTQVLTGDVVETDEQVLGADQRPCPAAPHRKS